MAVAATSIVAHAISVAAVCQPLADRFFDLPLGAGDGRIQLGRSCKNKYNDSAYYVKTVDNKM